MTYRYAINSIERMLKKNFDDADISQMDILFWISVIANKYAARELDKSPGKRSGIYLSIFKSVAVLFDRDLKQHYINLPTGLLCLEYDSAIEFITYNRDTCCCEGPKWAQQNFSMTTAGALEMLFSDPWEKPTPRNPYAYLVGGFVDTLDVDRLYFSGTECIQLCDVMLGVYTGVDPRKICDLDSMIPLKSRYDDQLIREVTSLGRFMLMVPEDRTNEGADEGKPPPIRVPQSVSPAQLEQIEAQKQ